MTDILTPAEVAALFKISVHKVKRTVIARGVPVLRVGRDIRFDQQAIEAFTEAIRCPSKSPGGSPPARSRYQGRSRGSAYNDVRKAISNELQKKRQQRSKSKSSEPSGTENVVALDHSRKLSTAI